MNKFRTDVLETGKKRLHTTYEIYMRQEQQRIFIEDKQDVLDLNLERLGLRHILRELM